MLVEGSSVDEWLVALAAILIALGVIWRQARGIYKGVKRIEAVLGVDEKGRTIAERMALAEKQLAPNHGTSLVDRVEKIETSNEALATEFGIVKAMLARVLGHPEGSQT